MVRTGKILKGAIAMKNNYTTKTVTAASAKKASQKPRRMGLLDRFLEISTVPAEKYAHVKCSSAPFTSGFFQG